MKKTRSAKTSFFVCRNVYNMCFRYTTNSEAFVRLFELVIEAIGEVFERNPECPGTDMPVTKFSVIFNSNKTVEKTYMADPDEFSECFSILKKMVPPSELMPWVLRTSEDYYKERLWHTLVL